MNAFGDNFEQQSEVDPAAEFLAREQNALAGLEDEIPPVAAGAGTSANGSVNGDPVPKAGACVDKAASTSRFAH